MTFAHATHLPNSQLHGGTFCSFEHAPHVLHSYTSLLVYLSWSLLPRVNCRPLLPQDRRAPIRHLVHVQLLGLARLQQPPQTWLLLIIRGSRDDVAVPGGLICARKMHTYK